jgi:hypothetical protein
MLSTCRDVVIGVTFQPLNHSSTTSVGNRSAAAGHDRSGGPGLAGGGNPRVAADSKAPKGIANVVLARLKPAWHYLALPSPPARVGPSPWPAASSRAGLTAYAGQQPGAPISGRTNRVTATIRVGRLPVGVAANPETGTSYVVNDEDSTVSVLAPCRR